MTAPQQLLCRYHYDPLDRLAACAPMGMRLFYRKQRLATRLQDGLGQSIVEADDQLLVQQEFSAGSTQNTLLATDRQRSVLRTAQNGQQQALAYNAYGHQPAGNGLSSLLGFNGELRDPLTGHYLLGNGYRAYNPVLMRFNSPDSLSPFGRGGLNAYTYCAGDPVNYRDSSGHVPMMPAPSRSPVARSPRVQPRVNNPAPRTIYGEPLWTRSYHIQDLQTRSRVERLFAQDLSMPRPGARGTESSPRAIMREVAQAPVVAIARAPAENANVSIPVEIVPAGQRQFKFYTPEHAALLSEPDYVAHMVDNFSVMRYLKRSAKLPELEFQELKSKHLSYALREYQGRYGALQKPNTKRSFSSQLRTSIRRTNLRLQTLRRS